MNNVIQNIESSWATANDKCVVLLLVRSRQDQKLFKQFLPDHLTIETDPHKVDTSEIDLCIIDEHSISPKRDWLRELKQTVAPIFLPLLLLSKDKETVRQNEILFEFVDDVVYIPASSKLLKSRIQILLKQRDYSLKLEEKNRQLEQKNIELAEEKRKYQLITQNATDMISRHSPDGTYLYASEASEELTGYSPDELLGQNAFANMHPDDREQLMNDEELFEKKLLVTWTFRKQTKDEGYRWVESTLRPILDEETGEIEEIQASTRDITQRKKYEEELRKSRKQWRKLVKNNPNLIQILDSEGTIIFINKAGAELLGQKDPNTLIGKNYFDLIELDQEKWEMTKSRVYKVLDGKKVGSQIYRIMRLDGEKRYIQSQAMPITLDDGQLGIQQVAQDITEQIKSEQNLKESLHEKEILLQEIHHRVKNNLAVVSGMLQLQAYNSEDEELKKLLHDSESRIKTMALIHEKLYQSQSLSQIDFGLYVKELINNIKKVSVPRDHINICLDFDSFNLNVNQAVPCALIINEIISNSFEHAFTEQKEGRITIQLQKVNNRIKVCISDNGKGLPAGYDQKESMGFTIINTLITQLEADYEIDSDNGTTFSFAFNKQQIKGSSSALIQNIEKR